MKRAGLTSLIIGFAALLLPAGALADVPSLQVAPLSYTGNLKSGVIESGFVDVSNPTDETTTVTSSVEGFHQIDTRGDLTFFSSPRLNAAITVGLSDFELGPRQSIRVVFSIDPTKLPQGGVYAAIFFQTQSPAQTSQNSFVVESAKVGTLLILTNGGPGAHRGAISDLDMSFLQFGSGISGSVTFKNTDESDVAVAFTPNLVTTILPWGHATKMPSGLLLPGVTRVFNFNRPGNYFGLIPITATATHTGAYRTGWVFADTGLYRPGVPIALVILIALIVLRKKNKRKTAAEPIAPKPILPDEEPAPEPELPQEKADLEAEPEPELPKAQTDPSATKPVVKIKPTPVKPKPPAPKRKSKPRKRKPKPS